MKKSELLKLKPGQYLVTDNICNYTYELHKYDSKDGLIASLINRLGRSGGIYFHYGLIQSFDDDFDRYIPLKRMDVNISCGGISISQKGSYNTLNEINIVCKYNKETVSIDLKKFRLNHIINMCRYDSKNFRKYNC